MLGQFVQWHIAEGSKFNQILQALGISLFALLGEPDEFLMLLCCERPCLTPSNELVRLLLRVRRETVIDFQQEFRFGLGKVWRALLDTELQKFGNKLLQFRAG